MKGYWLTLLVLLLTVAGCDDQAKKEQLQKKETELNQKEQELARKEQNLQLKEAAIMKRELALDSSTRADSGHLVNPAITGNWRVKMTCTETSCTGSAVGDVKTEDWDLFYQGTTVVARAMAAGQLVRTYLGFYTGNTIELVANRDTSASAVKMVVRLRSKDESHLQGQREITREDCKVIYDLKLEKNNG